MEGPPSKRDYQYLVDRVNGKLAGWRSKTLSMAGRATLIQSSLSTIPTYVMQTAKLPRTTCDEIDRKARGFLWGEQEGKRKVHMVAWNKMNLPKKDGGLGIRDMRQTNQAFLAKLGWRLLVEPQTLWSRILRAKYCDNRCDLDMFKEKCGASRVWRGIMSSVDVVRKGINMAVGGGSRTFLWHHRWATKDPLLSKVVREPPLRVQDMTVREMWDPNVGWKYELFAHSGAWRNSFP